MSEIAILGAHSFLARAIRQEAKYLEVKGYSRSGNLIYSFPHQSFYSGFDVRKLLASQAIFYCAGLGIQPGNRDSERLIYELNFFEPMRLIRQLSHLGYGGKLITFGSYFEYGVSEKRNKITEEELIKNNNAKPEAYSLSKSMLTSFIDEQIKIGNKNLVHLILPNIYGSGENKNRLFPLIKNSIDKKEKIKFTSGDQVRQFVYKQDVARFVVQILKKNIYGIYNLGTKEQTVKSAILEAIQALKNNNTLAQYEFTAMKKRDSSMPYLVLDDTKARKNLGWNTSTSIQEAIKLY